MARVRRSTRRCGAAVESFVSELEPGARAVPICVAGFTDSHWLRDAFGTVAYGFFPTADDAGRRDQRQLIHSADERIPVDDLELGVDWLRHAARSVLRVTVELGSLAELEPALAAEDFEVARVFVSYGACAPSAPEPCVLPRVAYSLDPPEPVRGAFSVGEWTATWSEREYADAVGVVRAAIFEGDVYQVNLVQHLRAGFDGDPAALAAALAPLRPLEPAPLAGDGWAIVSASPELMLQKRGRIVRTSPIKGTRPAGVARSIPRRTRRST